MQKKDDFVYGGHDLESMLNAQKYYSWVARMFGDHIGKNIVEVGAGTGSFTKHLLERKPQSLTLVEPSVDMYPHLQKRVKSLAKLAPETTIQTHNGSLKDIQKTLKTKPDTIIYVNVMEHIEDDADEIKLAYKLLKPGGTLLIFVPALQRLLGSFDKQVGHHRRYHKKDLIAKHDDAGFVIEKAHYVDMLGITPWWLSFRVLKRKKLNQSVVRLYDNLAVPVISTLEGAVTPPIGKNLISVARKPR